MDEKPYEERDRKNPLLKALTVLSKYSEEIDIHAEHDELSFWIDEYEKISEEDLRYILYLWGIGWDEEYDYFYYLT